MIAPTVHEPDVRFKNLIEGWAEAVWEADADGVIVENSPSWRAQTGQTTEEWQRYGWAEVIHADDRDDVLQRWRAAVDASGTFEAECRMRSRGGDWEWFNMRATPVLDARGVLLNWVGMNVDVGERRTAELALHASEERYRLIVENAADYAIVVMDDNGRIESWSAGAEAAFGWKAQQAVGRSFSILFAPPDRTALLPKNMLAQTRAQRSVIVARWYQRKDGSGVFIEGSLRAVAAADGLGHAGSVMIGKDVTERRRIEQALRDSEERYRTLVENPEPHLAAEAFERLRSATERNTLRRRLWLAEEEERRRLSRELHDEVGQHLTALSLGLQELSNVIAPGSPGERQAAALRAAVETLGRELHGVAVRLRPKALDDFGFETAVRAYADEWSQRTGIAVDIHTGGEVERLAPPTESALYRIVQEALTNVARHSEAQSVGIVVERLNEYVHAIVEDDGRGFDPGELDGNRRPGLGLLGIRERAELLGGSVEIESAPGRGTTLFVRLPLREQDDVERGAPAGRR